MSVTLCEGQSSGARADAVTRTPGARPRQASSHPSHAYSLAPHPPWMAALRSAVILAAEEASDRGGKTFVVRAGAMHVLSVLPLCSLTVRTAALRDFIENKQ